MAWVWARIKGSVFFANFTIEKITEVLICTPLCIAIPLGTRLKKISARIEHVAKICKLVI